MEKSFSWAAVLSCVPLSRAVQKLTFSRLMSLWNRSSGLGSTEHFQQALLCNQQERKKEESALYPWKIHKDRDHEILWVPLGFQCCEKRCVSCLCPIPVVSLCSCSHPTQRHSLSGKLKDCLVGENSARVVLDCWYLLSSRCGFVLSSHLSLPCCCASKTWSDCDHPQTLKALLDESA